MYIVSVCFVIKDAYVELFKKEMSQQARRCLDREEGCLQFDLGQDPDNPSRFFLYELYTDEAAFEVHKKTEHFVSFAKLVGDWIAERSLDTWQRIEQQ